jgi:hypothetical protein
VERRSIRNNQIKGKSSNIFDFSFVPFFFWKQLRKLRKMNGYLAKHQIFWTVVLFVVIQFCAMSVAAVIGCAAEAK